MVPMCSNHWSSTVYHLISVILPCLIITASVITIFSSNHLFCHFMKVIFMKVLLFEHILCKWSIYLNKCEDRSRCIRYKPITLYALYQYLVNQRIYTTAYGAPVAQWVKRWPTNLAVVSSSLARGEIFSTVNWVSVHTPFHYQPLIVLIWLKYCWKERKIASHTTAYVFLVGKKNGLEGFLY